MKQKSKFFLGLILVLISCVACEKNDLCAGVDVDTPQVNIKLYNRLNNEELKTAQQINCFALDYVNQDTIPVVEYSSVNEFTLPLKVYENNTVWYIELKEWIGNDTITRANLLNFNYETNSQYVSKACGYRTVFERVRVTATQDDIQQLPAWISTLDYSNEITSNDTTHVQIYF